jgi:hypothetical protein
VLIYATLYEAGAAVEKKAGRLQKPFRISAFLVFNLHAIIITYEVLARYFIP